MQKESLHNININELLSEDAAQSIKQMMDTIATVQSGLYRLYVSDDSRELNLVKIGTVFQIFFLDTLAKGKDAKDLDENDWKNIADKVYMYAVIEEGHSYSSFVFTMYADYIDVSAKVLEKNISNQNLKEILS